LLNEQLPPFLVEHKQWYGIVSKGIHELTESECLDYFPVVRSGIEVVLEQKADALERTERAKAASEAIRQLSAKLATPPEET
jgi:hypothetical protein